MELNWTSIRLSTTPLRSLALTIHLVEHWLQTVNLHPLMDVMYLNSQCHSILHRIWYMGNNTVQVLNTCLMLGSGVRIEDRFQCAHDKTCPGLIMISTRATLIEMVRTRKARHIPIWLLLA